MDSQAAKGRQQLGSRMRAVHDAAASKLGVDAVSEGGTTYEAVQREDLHAKVTRPFRASWDFDKPWRNKK